LQINKGKLQEVHKAAASAPSGQTRSPSSEDANEGHALLCKSAALPKAAQDSAQALFQWPRAASRRVVEIKYCYIGAWLLQQQVPDDLPDVLCDAVDHTGVDHLRKGYNL
jgi:hypothetical protein